MFLQLHKVIVRLAISLTVFSSLSQALPGERWGESSGFKLTQSSYEEDGVQHTVVVDEINGCTIDYVKNSGICETTPGVNQYSGYFSVGRNESMWFWFFESRNDPASAPLAVWFNGGPGCSSMIGLFQENGPCGFYDNATTPSLNPYSWNEYANMLYIDEPIGVGFSYGTDPANSTVGAAPYVWTLLQAFFAHFPQYDNREFGLFTESYGGHYGPEFAYYFQQQNDAIEKGHLHGETINLIALGINNGWYDATIQEIQFINFSLYNTYYPLINESVYTAYLNASETLCAPAEEACTAVVGENTTCWDAQIACANVDDYYSQFYPDNYDPYDIRQPASEPFPSENYVAYLQDAAIQKAIGAKSNYSECSNDAGNGFWYTADEARSFIPILSDVVQTGLTTVLWAGDADSVCDWFGGFHSANAITYSGTQEFVNKEVANYTVKGEVGGTFKNVENLSWLRVFHSGHEVPAFQPALALQVFIQTMQKMPLHST